MIIIGAARGSPPPWLNRDLADALPGASIEGHAVEKHREILRPGEAPYNVHVLVNGHACRYRMLDDGRRQITALMVPGDVYDAEAALCGRSDCHVSTLTDCTIGRLSVDVTSGGLSMNSALMAALVARVCRDASIAREGLVSLGRRDSTERLAHLFCEMRTRFAAVGLASENSYELRITQEDVADVLGLTSVHVNRTLKHLRDAGLATFKGGDVTMLDRPALEHLAKFDPAYLRHEPNDGFGATALPTL